MKVAKFIVDEIERDQIPIENTVCAGMFSAIADAVKLSGRLNPDDFITSENPGISRLAVELLSPVYLLSENWEAMHKIFVPEEEKNLKDSVEKSVYHLKNKQVMKMLDDNSVDPEQTYVLADTRQRGVAGGSQGVAPGP